MFIKPLTVDEFMAICPFKVHRSLVVSIFAQARELVKKLTRNG